MRKSLLLAAVASLCAGVAFAQAPTPGTEQPRHERHDMLAEADTNHDGVISRQEFDAAHAAMFDRLDTNHDGFLSPEDHPGMMRMHGPDGPGGGHRGGHDGGWMQHLDANHDGNISRDEFLAGPIERFNRLDANHNGIIEASEIPQHREHGPGGPEGGPPGPGGEHMRHGFADADANHDGKISREEFVAQAHAMFDRIDANHDGRLTQDELAAAHPRRAE